MVIRDLTDDDLYLDDHDDHDTEPDPLDPFFAEGLITEVLRTEKSGKEGTVYACAAAPTTEHEILAAKVYRPRSRRNFKDDSVYREGRKILNGHDSRAVKRKSDWGRQFQFGTWIHHEYETLGQLHAAGLDVPTPVRMAGTAILMSYVGDDEMAAPALQAVQLEEGEARPMFNRLMWNIERMLAHNQIHGDLSPFNVLYWDGRATIIDFPQSVDPRANTNAFDLLARDIDRICTYFQRYGVQSDPQRIARFMWGKFIRAEL